MRGGEWTIWANDRCSKSRGAELEAVQRGDRAVVARPPERVLELLDV